jgi:hypothetical protein
MPTVTIANILLASAAVALPAATLVWAFRRAKRFTVDNAPPTCCAEMAYHPTTTWQQDGWENRCVSCGATLYFGDNALPERSPVAIGEVTSTDDPYIRPVQFRSYPCGFCGGLTRHAIGCNMMLSHETRAGPDLVEDRPLDTDERMHRNRTAYETELLRENFRQRHPNMAEAWEREGLVRPEGKEGDRVFASYGHEQLAERMLTRMRNGEKMRPVRWLASSMFDGGYCYVRDRHTFVECTPATVGVEVSPAIVGIREAIRKYGVDWETYGERAVFPQTTNIHTTMAKAWAQDVYDTWLKEQYDRGTLVRIDAPLRSAAEMRPPNMGNDIRYRGPNYTSEREVADLMRRAAGYREFE